MPNPTEPQPRERPAPCRQCHREVWTVDALHDRCRDRVEMLTVVPADEYATFLADLQRTGGKVLSSAPVRPRGVDAYAVEIAVPVASR